MLYAVDFIIWAIILFIICLVTRQTALAAAFVIMTAFAFLAAVLGHNDEIRSLFRSH